MFLLRPNYDAAATMATPLRSHGDLTRTQQECRVSATVLCMFKYSPTVCDLVRPWVPRYDLAASMATVLRPGRSKVAVRTQLGREVCVRAV